MDNNAAKDPWANMGNMAPGNQAGEISQEGLEREQQWQEAMSDVPEFDNNLIFGAPQESFVTPTPEAQPIENQPERNDMIAGASELLSQGNFNALSKTIGIVPFVQAIEKYTYQGAENPISELSPLFGVGTDVIPSDIKETAQASKPEESYYIGENVNAPTSTNKSATGVLKAIESFKDLIKSVNTDPEFAELRKKAKAVNKNPFEYAADEQALKNNHNAGDLTSLLGALSEYKTNYEAAKKQTITEKPEDNPEDDKPEEDLEGETVL